VILQSDDVSLLQKLSKPGAFDEMLLMGNAPQDLQKSADKRLEYLILERLLDSEVKRLNFSITVERVEQEIRDRAKMNGMSRNEMMAAIKAQGVSASEYQDFLKTRIERQSLIESEISNKVRVSDDEVLGAYMRSNPKTDTGVFEYQLAHIFFNPKKGSPEAAQKRALEVYSKLKAGGEFDLLAEQNSEDSNFTAGGALGTFKAGEFSKEFESAVQNLNVGDYSAPVASRSGVHILRVLNKKLVTDPKFEEQKERIRASLSEKAFRRHFETWLQTKRDESFVRINK
jgi:peptidyl-prolyl cis-trans isomerase SurA